MSRLTAFPPASNFLKLEHEKADRAGRPTAVRPRRSNGETPLCNHGLVFNDMPGLNESIERQKTRRHNQPNQLNRLKSRFRQQVLAYPGTRGIPLNSAHNKARPGVEKMAAFRWGFSFKTLSLPLFKIL
jgi:hypothetical protein